jgi:hypothetical protein
MGMIWAKDPEFGIKNIDAAAKIDPPTIKGILRPKRVHVRSLQCPISGCMIIPVMGAANQK